MSSTEAEVTAANLAMRAVGLPSSCLWSVIRIAGGDDRHNADSTLPRGVETSAKNTSKDDYWEHHQYTNMVTRVHVKPRKVLLNPIDSDCPIDLTNLTRQRYPIMQHDEKIDFDITWDWTSPLSDVFQDFEWTGKSVFRIPGPNEVDYGIESREIKSALTDNQYVGNERIGDESIYMVGPGSLEVVFLEDNQATIRILETGRSPAFRHTDKTQRLNLGWLAEQFRRKHFRFVYVNSILQAADVLTKPFTNAEKWNVCLRLMNIVDSSVLQAPKARKACAGEPVCPSLVFDKIWAAMVHFVNIIRHLSPIIAIEWPSNCVYWKFERVMQFCQKHHLKEVTFDGCMIGSKDHNGVATKNHGRS